MNLIFVIVTAFLCMPGAARAEGIQSVAPQAEPVQKDLDEVEDIPSDDDFLPADESVLPVDNTKSKRIEEEVGLVLDQTDSEIRSQHSYGVSVIRGTASPWLGYGLDIRFLYSPLMSFGMVLGTGEFEDADEIVDRSYNISYKAKSVSFAVRRFFENYNLISFQVAAGYALWEGTVVPSGSDDLSGDDQKLTSSFETNGWFVGTSLGLSWYWSNGFFVTWEPVGIQISGVMQIDTSRDSDSVNNAVHRTIESAAIYGISNVKLGVLF